MVRFSKHQDHELYFTQLSLHAKVMYQNVPVVSLLCAHALYLAKQHGRMSNRQGHPDLYGVLICRGLETDTVLRKEC